MLLECQVRDGRGGDSKRLGYESAILNSWKTTLVININKDESKAKVRAEVGLHPKYTSYPESLTLNGYVYTQITVLPQDALFEDVDEFVVPEDLISGKEILSTNQSLSFLKNESQNFWISCKLSKY